MSTLITFDHVTLGYRRAVVVADLSFTIRAGEFFGIVGANGSGKTTILRALLGILGPRSGRIVYEPPGPDGTPLNRCEATGGGSPMAFGYVPQRAFLDDIWPLTAREVVLMGRYGALAIGDRPTRHDRAVVERSLEQVGLTDRADRLFRELSGGQKQRALIARALATESPVLVLDEPTDGMDLDGQQRILELIAHLRATTGLTVVYVTHRLNELANAATRLLLLHEGTVRLGTPDEMLRSEVLREVYGVDVRVLEVDGKKVMVT